MNQWLLAFLVFWMGTGTLVVLSMFAEAAKERAKRCGGSWINSNLETGE